MKQRLEKDRIADEAERELAHDVRRRAAASHRGSQVGPTDPYWQNLIIRTNARIDDATSGKALSISWAMRVAIPGVVAIVSFLIGLHYYVPEPPEDSLSVAAVMQSLPSAVLDSILSDPSRLDPSLSVQDVGGYLFAGSREQIADYLVVNGSLKAAVEELTEKERSDLLAALGTSGSLQ